VVDRPSITVLAREGSTNVCGGGSEGEFLAANGSYDLMSTRTGRAGLRSTAFQDLTHRFAQNFRQIPGRPPSPVFEAARVISPLEVPA
jgi:hypothetical protein